MITLKYPLIVSQIVFIFILMDIRIANVVMLNDPLCLVLFAMFCQMVLHLVIILMYKIDVYILCDVCTM